jgi:DNA-binding response OmpR family regulator
MRKRLLIADDDRLFLNILTLEFEKRDSPCEIITVEDGGQTITMLDERAPDLLILDLRMPTVDGYGILKHMKEKHEQVPVIVVTHFPDAEHQKKSEEFGVKAYIVKSQWPIHRLTDEIEKHMDIVREGK